jgi:hypothetical protein
VTTDALVARVAAHGLDGRTVAGDGLPDDAFGDLLAACTRERIVGLLVAAVEDGALPVSEGQLAALAAQHGTLMVRAVQIEAAALDAIGRLADAGIEVRVLKGLATAHLDHPEPSWRTFVDADLLLPPACFAEGVALLAGAYRGRDLVERRPGFEARFGKDVTVYGPGVELDLHRTLALGAFGLAIDLDDLWSATERFELGGRQVTALDPVRRLLHACLGAVLGDPQPRVSTLRDVLSLLARPGFDADEVEAAAARWRCRAPVAAAIRTAVDTIGVTPATPLVAWARGCRPARWERMVLRTYPAMGGSNAACILSGAAALGPVDAAAYLRAVVAPGRAYREARRSSHRPGELRTGAREIARLLRR